MTRRSGLARTLLVGLAFAVAVAACGSGDEETTETTAAAQESAATDGSMTATRDDVDCSTEGLGEEAESHFTTAHYVVGGELGAVCMGEENATLVDAWSLLKTMTPQSELNHLGVFAGFEGGGDGDEVTVAFVNTVREDGSLYQMSVNLQAAEEDRDDLLMTMAHEFTHVFNAIPSQLDRNDDGSSCSTYFNGEGCYTESALMTEWIATFWSDGLIDEVDPDAEATADEGQDRCDLNPGFFGAYAASSPEEDFAESFAAFVLQVPAKADAQQEKLDWFAAIDELAVYRANATAASFGPLDNNFDDCG